MDTYFPYKGGLDPHVNIDEVEATTSEVLYTSEDGMPRVFLNATDAYNVISSTIVFGALKDNDSLNLKTYFMAEMIDYLKENSSLGIEKPDNSPVLSWAYPNPAISEINIYLELQSRDFIEIEIFNINGKLISHIASELLPSGKYTYNWNLKKHNGQKAEPGVYFYRLRSSASVYTNSFVIY